MVAGDPIRDYIAANRDRYTREAIREQLLAAGHDPAAVDAGLELASAADQPRDPAPPGSRAARLLSRTATVLFIAGGLIGLGGFAIGGSYYGGSLPFFLLAYGGIGIAIIVLMRRVVPRLPRVDAWSGLIFLGVLFAYPALLYGSCAAAAGIGRS